MATQEEKELRQKVLDDIKRKRAAAAQAEGSLGAAERGEYGEVGQGEKGSFDDEIEQGRGSEDPTVSAFSPSDIQEITPLLDTVSPLDLSNKGIAALMRKRIPLLVAADFVSSQIPKTTKEALSETLNKPLFPGLSNKIRETLGFEQKAVTDTGEILNMKADDLKGLFGGGGKKIEIDFQDKNILDILEKARTGKVSELQAALEIQKLFPGSGMVGIDTAAAAGIKTNPKFRNAFQEYVSNKNANDVFEATIIGDKNATLTRTVKNNILSAKRIADEDLSDVSYAVKFREALSNFYSPRKEKTYSNYDSVFYKDPDPGALRNAKAIFKYLDEDPSILDMKIGGTGETGLVKWNKIKVNSDQPIRGAALRHFKNAIVHDETGKSFKKIKSEILNKNKFVKSVLLQTKSLFKNPKKVVTPYELDHIQPPRFGGTNAESNFQLLMRGEHVNLKNLPQFKSDAFAVVKSKTNFENEFFNKSVKIIDLIKKGDTEKALKLSVELDTVVNGFKNTYRNINFKVGEPYFPVKTGDTTGKYVKYVDQLKLSPKQKKLVNELLNKEEYSNFETAGKTFEQQAKEILNSYEQLSLLTPGGKIPVKIPKTVVEGGMKTTQFTRLAKGGMASIFDMTGPLNAQR